MQNTYIQDLKHKFTCGTHPLPTAYSPQMSASPTAPTHLSDSASSGDSAHPAPQLLLAELVHWQP